MNFKKYLICVSIVAILTLCVPSVAAVPMNKLKTTHSNYAGDERGGQQTYIAADLGVDCAKAITIGVGQSVYLNGELSYDIPPTDSWDYSHGIANKTVNIQSMNPDGQTWTTVATRTTLPDDPQTGITGKVYNSLGRVVLKLTPMAAGVYTYRVTYDGDNQYNPAISNTVTLTVTNMVIS